METRRTIQSLVSVVALAMVMPATAFAEQKWSITGAGSGAAPLNGPYDRDYGLGYMGGAGVYRSLMPQLGVGLRVDGGRVSQEDERDPSLGEGGMGFGALSPSVRVRPLSKDHGDRGLYIDLAGGASLLEGEIEPVLSPGAGYIFDAGPIGLGPTARYMQMITGDNDAPDGKDVRIMTVGLELVFLGQKEGARAPAEEYAPEPTLAPAPPPAAAMPPEEPPPVAEPTPPPVEEEEEGLPSEEVEPVAGEEAQPLQLDQRVLFAHGEATLSSDARSELDRIVEQYREEQGEQRWTALRIKGYADQTGSSDFNMELSRKRAEAARDYLISAGIPAEIIEVTAFGEQRPAVPEASTPSELRQNRRVEFEVERGGPGQPME